MTGPAWPPQGDTIPPGYRDVRMAREPVVSVVVVAAGPDSLARSLAGLAAECGGRGVELVAVHGGGAVDPAPLGAANPSAPGALEASFPGVRFVRAGRVTGAVLRQRGLAAAEGDIVLFADEADAVEPGWLDRRLRRWPVRDASPRYGASRPSEPLTTASPRVQR